MADYMITFEASGGMTVNAANEDEARRIFGQADKQEIAWNELKASFTVIGLGTNEGQIYDPLALMYQRSGTKSFICPL